MFFVAKWVQGVVAMVFLYSRLRLVEHLCSMQRVSLVKRASV